MPADHRSLRAQLVRQRSGESNPSFSPPLSRVTSNQTESCNVQPFSNAPSNCIRHDSPPPLSRENSNKLESNRARRRRRRGGGKREALGEEHCSGSKQQPPSNQDKRSRVKGGKGKSRGHQRSDVADVCDPRLARLIEHLVSPAVQLQVPQAVSEEQARLSEEEVARVFKQNVPGVEGFLYRQQCGNYSLKYILQAYHDGIFKFKGTELEGHFKSLFRVVVHYAEAGKPGARGFLQEVAEAFMDCQDIQARAIEHVGFQICGLTLDFRGLLVQLADEYKSMAMKFLVATEIEQRGGPDDWMNDPVHFENRVVADVGETLGLNAGDIRRALLDEHKERNPPFKPSQRSQLAEKFCAFFDLDVMLQSFVCAANSFSETSPKESLPKLFLDWVSERMPEKHLVLDEETCTRVEINIDFALAIMELVFLGETRAQEEFRGRKLSDLFTTTFNE